MQTVVFPKAPECKEKVHRKMRGRDCENKNREADTNYRMSGFLWDWDNLADGLGKTWGWVITGY